MTQESTAAWALRRLMEFDTFVMNKGSITIDNYCWIIGCHQSTEDMLMEAYVFFLARKQAEELVKTAKVIF